MLLPSYNDSLKLTEGYQKVLQVSTLVVFTPCVSKEWRFVEAQFDDNMSPKALAILIGAGPATVSAIHSESPSAY